MADDPTTSPESDATGTESVTQNAPAEDLVAQTDDAPTDAAETGSSEAAVVQASELAEEPAPAPTAPEAPAAATAPVATPPEPSIATTLLVEPTPVPLASATGPAASPAGDEEGGEWELLLQKLRHWLNQGELQALWAQAQKPVTALAALVALLMVLRVYTAVLGALDSLPLVPGLLELAGVVWLVRYGVPKLVRSSEREQLLSGVSNRWKAFRGKG